MIKINAYEVTIKSMTAAYQVPVYASDELNAAFAAGRQVTNYPARYPRPIGDDTWTVTDIKEVRRNGIRP
jgi:hypothetical protein